MKIKILSLSVIFSIILAYATAWQSEKFFVQGRSQTMKINVDQQLDLIEKAFDEKLGAYKKMAMGFSHLQSGFNKEAVNWSASDALEGVALFQIPLGANDYIQQSFFTRHETDLDQGLMLQSIHRMQSLAKTKSFVDAVQDRKKQGQIFLVLNTDVNKTFVFWFNSRLFASFDDVLKNQDVHFQFLTADGRFLTNSKPEYIGMLSSHKDLQGNFVSDRSLTSWGAKVTSQISVAAIGSGIDQLKLKIYSLAAGVALIMLALLFVVLKDEEEVYRRNNHAAILASKALATVGAVSLDNNNSVASAGKLKSTNPEIEKSSKENYKMIAGALARELRGPLASISASAQAALGNSQETEKYLNEILNESNQGRSLVDKLSSFAEEKDLEKLELKLEGPLEMALKKLEGLFQNKGIRIEKEIQSSSALYLNSLQISQAIQNILNNSVEALERLSDKKIKINLFENSDCVVLEVIDNGEGIDQKNLNQICDPFFTTRAYMNHSGLGLSAAVGIFKSHDGKVEIFSEKEAGKRGTTVRVSFVKNLMPAISKEKNMKNEITQKIIPQDLVEKEEQQELKNIEVKNPGDVNIDTLFDFPGMQNNQLAASEELSLSINQEPISLSAEGLANLVARPSLKDRIINEKRKSKLDNFEVIIPRPGRDS